MNWSVYIDECNEENQNKYEQVDELIVDMFLLMITQPHNDENDFYRNIYKNGIKTKAGKPSKPYSPLPKTTAAFN